MEPDVVPMIDRALPFLMRRDLLLTSVDSSRQAEVVVKDPVALRYFQLSTAQAEVLQALDGSATLHDLLNCLAYADAAVRPNLATIRAWLQDFLTWNLVLVDRPGAQTASVKSIREESWRNFWNQWRSPLYVQFPGFTPHRILEPLMWRFGWCFSAPAIVVATLWMLVVWSFGLVHFNELQQRAAASIPAIHSWGFWFQLWIVIGMTKILHELGHGLAARRFGAECHSIGFALVFFSPCLYCDVTDAWSLPRRGPRVAIALAGVYVELVVGTCAFLLWWHTASGSLHDWCGQVAMVSSAAAILVNLNPLARYDGYYILSDLLGVPNLRQQADRAVDGWLRRIVHGAQDRLAAQRPPLGQSLLLMIYAIAAGMYRSSMVCAIGYGLEMGLAPLGLSGFVWAYMGMAVIMLLYQGGKRTRRILDAEPGRGFAWVWWCLGIVGMAACGYGAVTVPLPNREAVPFVIEADAAQHVYATTSGDLIEVLVPPGAVVQRGQPLARLRNIAREEQRLSLLALCAREEQNLTQYQALNQTAAVEQTRETLHKLADQKTEVERLLEQLTILAPCDGVVIAPPDTTTDDQQSARTVLSRWSGRPLDPRQTGCLIEAGTWLLSIAPTESRRSVLFVEQRLRRDVVVGQPVTLQAEAWPRYRPHALIVDVPANTVREIPAALASSNAGPLNATAANNGKYTVSNGIFRITVAVPEEFNSLPLGTTGWAWMSCQSKTLCERTGDYLLRSFPALGPLLDDGKAALSARGATR